jgi:hypothetical protein
VLAQEPTIAEFIIAFDELDQVVLGQVQFIGTASGEIICGQERAAVSMLGLRLAVMETLAASGSTSSTRRWRGAQRQRCELDASPTLRRNGSGTYG